MAAVRHGVTGLAVATIVGLAGAAPALPRAVIVIADVLAYPGHRAGPVRWKEWRADVATAFHGGVTFRIPIAPQFNAAALSDLLGSSGVRIGHATISETEDWDDVDVASGRLVTGACTASGGESPGAWRIELRDGCLPIRVGIGPDHLVLAIDLTSRPAAWGAHVRIDNHTTGAGPLLHSNPASAVRIETRAAADPASGALEGGVVEVLGGRTGVELSAARREVVYGRSVLFTVRVRRNGEPAAGETVRLAPFSRSTSSVPVGAPVQRTTEDGRARFSVRPRSTTRWAAWSFRAGSPYEPGRPRLNLLASVALRAIVVRAPRPAIRKRNVQGSSDGSTRAEIVVVNPLAPRETLRCRLVVGRRTYDRRFTSTSSTLVFRVIGRSGVAVRAEVYRRGRGNEIAPARSRTIRL
jgi:hypothetical protein